MNYSNHYRTLMLRAIDRETHGYVERHHVIPKCLGGEHGPQVYLYPEEHYVAHQLLMRQSRLGKPSPLLGHKLSKATKRKMSLAKAGNSWNVGRKHTPRTKLKMSESQRKRYEARER